jgi:glyoxylase I family protein
MRPDRLHHLSLNVRDAPAALDSYARVLGLTERTDRPDFSFGGAWLDAGGQQIHLIEADAPPSLGQHFALAVTDLDRAITELRGMGVAVTDPVKVGTGRQSFLDDPAGNRVELQEPGP